MFWCGSSYSEHVFRYIDKFIVYLRILEITNISIEWLPLVYTSGQLLTSLSCFTSFFPLKRFYDLHGLSPFLQHENLGGKTWMWNWKIGFFALRSTWLVSARRRHINKNKLLVYYEFNFWFFFAFFSYILFVWFCFVFGVCFLLHHIFDFSFPFLPQIVIVLKPFRINS